MKTTKRIFVALALSFALLSAQSLTAGVAMFERFERPEFIHYNHKVTKANTKPDSLPEKEMVQEYGEKSLQLDHTKSNFSDRDRLFRD